MSSIVSAQQLNLRPDAKDGVVELLAIGLTPAPIRRQRRQARFRRRRRDPP
ncbi:MAG: hypothetical protein R3C42_00595 [Parvularculaceae bacterium]